jgi:alkaline phosphatase D
MEPTMNLLLNHGVGCARVYAASGGQAKAQSGCNPGLAPHLEFVDLGGHGYGVVHVDATRMVTDFVCIPRPIERAATPDGGPLRYRVRHEVPLWHPGDHPQMRLFILDGDAGLAV